MMDGRKATENSGPSVLDVVALLTDFPALGLQRGQVGTVVERLDDQNSLVEFSDDEGRAYAIEPCPDSALLVVALRTTGSFSASVNNKNLPSPFGINVNVPEDVVRNAVEFLQRIADPLVGAAALLSDKLRFIRYRSAIKTLERAQQIAEQSRLKLRELPIKFLAPFLEASSIEDEKSELVDRWAALLVSAAENPERNLNWCVRILGELEPRQARLLDAVYIAGRTDRHSDMYTRESVGRQFEQELDNFTSMTMKGVENLRAKIDGYSFMFYEDDIPNTNELHLSGFDIGDDLLQLEALGLIWVFSSWVFIEKKKHFYIRAFLSPLGEIFVEACTRSEK